MQSVPFLVLVPLQLKCVLSSASKYTDTKIDPSICSLPLLPTWKTKMFHPFACLWSLMMWGVGTNFDFHVLNKNFLRKNRHSSSMSWSDWLSSVRKWGGIILRASGLIPTSSCHPQSTGMQMFLSRALLDSSSICFRIKNIYQEGLNFSLWDRNILQLVHAKLG
jgi:hypothetical protein